MAFGGICFQFIILKPIEDFIYSKFQITYQIITVSDVMLIKNKSQISILNNKGPRMDPCGTP